MKFQIRTRIQFGAIINSVDPQWQNEVLIVRVNRNTGMFTKVDRHGNPDNSGKMSIFC